MVRAQRFGPLSTSALNNRTFGCIIIGPTPKVQLWHDVLIKKKLVDYARKAKAIQRLSKGWASAKAP